MTQEEAIKYHNITKSLMSEGEIQHWKKESLIIPELQAIIESSEQHIAASLNQMSSQRQDLVLELQNKKELIKKLSETEEALSVELEKAKMDMLDMKSAGTKELLSITMMVGVFIVIAFYVGLATFHAIPSNVQDQVGHWLDLFITGGVLVVLGKIFNEPKK